MNIRSIITSIIRNFRQAFRLRNTRNDDANPSVNRGGQLNGFAPPANANDDSITEIIRHPVIQIRADDPCIFSRLERIDEKGSVIFDPLLFDSTHLLLQNPYDIKGLCCVCGMATKKGEDTLINCPVCHTGGYCFRHWKLSEDNIPVCLKCHRTLYLKRNIWIDQDNANNEQT